MLYKGTELCVLWWRWRPKTLLIFKDIQYMDDHYFYQSVQECIRIYNTEWMYSYNTQKIQFHCWALVCFHFIQRLKNYRTEKKTYLTGLQENQFNLSEHCVCMNLMQGNHMFQHSGSRCFSLVWGRLEISF